MRNNEDIYNAETFHTIGKYLNFETAYRRLRKGVTTKAHYRKENGMWSVYECKNSTLPLIIGCHTLSFSHLQYTRFLRVRRLCSFRNDTCQ